MHGLIAPQSGGDSDTFPQGPYANGGGEADSPQHCDHCAKFLENPLTSDGLAYVREATQDWQESSVGVPEVIGAWQRFYADELAAAFGGVEEDRGNFFAGLDIETRSILDPDWFTDMQRGDGPDIMFLTLPPCDND
jgi:hypothetical protein